MKNGAKMDPRAHSGAKGSQGGKKVPKIVWIWFGFASILAPSWHLKAPVWESFFNAFFEGVFFGPWAAFGCPRCPKGSQNGAKMEPKGCLKASFGR